MRKYKVAGITLGMVLCAGLAMAETINITPANAQVFFRVQHDLGYTVGYFKDFAGTVELNEDKTKVVSAQARVQTASVNTNNPVRDEGLRSAMFFDAGKFPQAVFENGALTLKGITKPLDLKIESGPAGKALLRATFNRNDFGINYNQPMAKNKKAIGDTVEIIVEVQP